MKAPPLPPAARRLRPPLPPDTPQLASLGWAMPHLPGTWAWHRPSRVGCVEAGAVKLTDLTKAGGCAAKYSAARLETLLAGFVPVEAENLLVGLAPADDAAVYKLDDERAIIFTLDFFPPLVDDPADFGAIAATNALNDVFAMGGSPLLALSIAAFPEELPVETLAAVFAAADVQVRAAGALLAGGHTIRDPEPKYGLAVVGTVHPAGIWPKNGARPGDALFLTKPLGTGLVLHGVKRGLAGDAELAGAVAWMRTLNREAADALRPFEPSAVTDVTGFGLLGHAHEMAERSGVELVLEAGALARARRRARGRACRRADRRRPAQPRVRGGAHRGRRGARRAARARLRPADRGRAAHLAPRGPRGHARGGVRLARAVPAARRQCRRGRRRHASLSPCTSSRRSWPASAGSRSRRPRSGGSLSRRR